MAGSFRAELIKKSPEPIDLYEVSLDTARVQDPHDEGLFVEYIRAVFYGRKLDLIVPVGAPAAFFMQRYRQMMFPTTISVVRGDVRAGHRPDVARTPTVSLQIIADRQPRSGPTPRNRGPSQFG